MREKLGEPAWDVLIGKTKEGSINAQHMKDISRALHSTVGGNHLRRVSEKQVTCDDFELREILSDWWDHGLSDLNNTEALGKSVIS